MNKLEELKALLVEQQKYRAGQIVCGIDPSSRVSALSEELLPQLIAVAETLKTIKGNLTHDSNCCHKISGGQFCDCWFEFNDKTAGKALLLLTKEASK